MSMIMTVMLISASTLCTYAQNTMTRGHMPARNTVTEKKLLRQISFLSDSLCRGRECGTSGSVEAAFWIQREYRKIGLLPFGESYGKKVYAGNGKIGRNIMGMLPGSKHFEKDRYVIVGAHYDHLGMIGERMFPGADANASGVAALLNIAGMLSTNKMLGKSYDSNVIFVAFDAKENGMAGSKALWRMIENGDLKDPQSGKVITKDKVTLMVNIDQIGSTMSPLKSGRKDYIIMLGTQSLKPIKREMLHTCNRMFAIDMDIDLTYYGSKNFTEIFYTLSDQRVFVENKIPAVLFTSGITMKTNKTTDTAESLDMEVLKKRIFLIYHWIEKML